MSKGARYIKPRWRPDLYTYREDRAHLLRVDPETGPVARGTERLFDCHTEALEFQALNWSARDDPHGQYVVYCTGATREGHSVTMQTPWFPHFKVKILDMTPDQVDKFEKTMRGRFKDAIAHSERVALKDLWAGFTGLEPARFPFIHYFFHTEAAWAHATSFVRREYTDKLAIYDTELGNSKQSDAFIRLFHATRIESTGWLRLPPKTYSWVRDADFGTQLVVHVPQVYDARALPECAEVAPFRVFSFDIESQDLNPEKAQCLQIAVACTDFGTNKVLKLVATLKYCDPIDEPDTILVVCATEKELLLCFVRWIQRYDPDIVHAYNGWGFDYYFLARRAELLGIWSEFSALGKLGFAPSKVVDKVMSSDAYGDNHWKQLPMSGRFCFDMMVHLQREFKLGAYGLNDVSEYFLSLKLGANPLRATQGSDRVHVTHPKHAFGVGTVLHFSGIETPDTLTHADGKQDYAWCGFTYVMLHGSPNKRPYTGLFVIEELSETGYWVRMPRAATRSCEAGGGASIKVFETKHDISFDEMNDAFERGDARVMRDVARYCVQDTLLPQLIFDKLCVLPNLIEMAKVTWVPLDFLIDRGQQVKGMSMISKFTAENEWAVPAFTHAQKLQMAAVTQGSYTGGMVFDPYVGFFDEPVTVPDFASLYPSEICDNNLCYTTLVRDARYANVPGAHYNRRVMPDGREHTFNMDNAGLVPQILEQLLDTRNKRKKDMANAKTALERMVHNGAQLALKVSANSIYGFMGVNPATAKLGCMPIAETTTELGRDATMTACTFLEDIENFRDVIACTTHMPLEWPHLMKNVAKKACFHMTTRALLKACNVTLAETDVFYSATLDLSIMGDADWTTLTGFTRDARGRVRVHLARGADFHMNWYRARSNLEPPPRAIPKEQRTAELAMDMCRRALCVTVYGDTDSVFMLYDSSHYAEAPRRVRLAFCQIISTFCAWRASMHIRAKNPHKPIEAQRMDLEYEKTCEYMLLYSKKRYDLIKYEFDPDKTGPDAKGNAEKRRDFCPLVKESMSKIKGAIFDPDRSVPRAVRIENATRVVKRSAEDLLNDRVPFEKLIVSKSLKDAYRMREKQAKKLRAKRQKYDFNPDNIFVRDKLVLRDGAEVCVLEKRATTLFDARAPLLVGEKSTKEPEEDEDADADRFYKDTPTREVTYDQIVRCKPRVVSLEWIMDPATPEAQLEPITNPHVRLARKRYKRDPTRAPRSGTRVPYVFCVAESASTLQYERAEDPVYAVEHGMRVDPVYYLEKQCQNAWQQVLDTVAPGVIGSLFDQSYARNALKQARQPTLAWEKTRALGQIELDEKARVTKKKKRAKPAPQKNTLLNFFK